MAKAIDQRAETESRPAMEIHLGEAFGPLEEQAGWQLNTARHCIIWMNGKRWEGTLFEHTERDL
ncbi:MAG: hypothetical protein ABSG46_20470 [Candidatus Binataceae bacterium]|jgi:hypothetical protein